MFKNIFFFSGRIRRLEYGLSNLFMVVFGIAGSYLADINAFLDSLFILLFLTIYSILFAQGAKRCHDLGNSGFYQFIPFYKLLLFFQEGEPKPNKFGINPKSDEYYKRVKVKTIWKIPNSKPMTLLLFEVINPVLIIVLLSASFNAIFPEEETISILFAMALPIPGFFITLLSGYGFSSINKNKSYLKIQQISFVVLYYIIFRSYNIFFRRAEIDIETFPLEILIILIFFGLTFISIWVHSIIFKAKSSFE